MAKYRIEYELISYAYAYIEANSPEEAYEIAEEMDGSEFTENTASAEWRYLCATDEETGTPYDECGNEI